MASSKRLKPITREALRIFYLSYPLEPVPVAECEELGAKLASLLSSVTMADSLVARRVHMETPTRIDDIMWRNR